MSESVARRSSLQLTHAEPDLTSTGSPHGPEPKIWATLVEANGGFAVLGEKYEPLGIDDIHIDGDLGQSGSITTA